MHRDKFNDSLAALLDEGRISSVIETMRANCAKGLAAHPALADTAAAVERISDTYTHLRRFLIDGRSDPSRMDVYSSIKEQLKEAGRNYLFIVNEDRLDPFFAEYRLRKVRNVTVGELAEELRKTDYRIEMASETEADPLPFIKKREEIIDSLFRAIWCLPPWAADERRAVSALLSDYSSPTPSGATDEVRAQIVSALLLGLLKFNDPGKFLLLMQAYEEAADERMAARALMAIVLVIGRWGRSLLSDPKVVGAIAALEESILTYSRLREIVMTLIRTRDTDRVSREVTEAINTTMREISPEMLQKLQNEGLTIDAAETGMNPEWEKLMKNKELEEKMKTINDMQLEGMDVMMQTFSRLKTFPFFRSVSNWFLPFSTKHSSVEGLFRSFAPEGFEAMASATEMCASDRFSFSLGIMQMPEDKRSMLSLHLGGQLEALRDMLKDRENVKRKPQFAAEALLYARDLYRFAKLFPKRSDFYDPFDDPIDFLRLPLLGTLLAGDDIILTSADFYFRHGYYPLALSLYREAETSGDAERHLYEKMGYCHQMNSDLHAALAEYEKADLFSSDVDRSSTWLLKKLAFCNKALGHYDKAAEYYSRLLERNPEDINLEFHLGSVLLRSGDVKKGKELISKVHYLDPEHKMASRIYTRLKGHDAFLEGRFADAVRLYEEARGDQAPTEYHKDLVTEISTLSPQVDVATLRILLDE